MIYKGRYTPFLSPTPRQVATSVTQCYSVFHQFTIPLYSHAEFYRPVLGTEDVHSDRHTRAIAL